MTGPVLECKTLSKSFGSTPVLGEVTLSLDEGEVLSVLGPSGSGKTTLLRLVAGFDDLDEGESHIGGTLVSRPGLRRPPEARRVGMLFQEYALFPHLTVAGNVAFGLRGMERGERKARLGEVMELVRLSGLEDRYPHELSGGQQQRVALARTLAPRPLIVLLDEPFSNLDAALRTQMRREVAEILRLHHTSTVFVTHDREEALAMADRIAVLGHGKLQQVGRPDVVFNLPANPFVARVTGTCDFLPAQLRDGVAVSEIGKMPWVSHGATLRDDAAVQLLVHLDDLRPVADETGVGVVESREFRGDLCIVLVRLGSGTAVRCREPRSEPLVPGTRVALTPSGPAPFLAFPV